MGERSELAAVAAASAALSGPEHRQCWHTQRRSTAAGAPGPAAMTAGASAAAASSVGVANAANSRVMGAGAGMKRAGGSSQTPPLAPPLLLCNAAAGLSSPSLASAAPCCCACCSSPSADVEAITLTTGPPPPRAPAAFSAAAADGSDDCEASDPVVPPDGSERSERDCEEIDSEEEKRVSATPLSVAGAATTTGTLKQLRAGHDEVLAAAGGVEGPSEAPEGGAE